MRDSLLHAVAKLIGFLFGIYRSDHSERRNDMRWLQVGRLCMRVFVCVNAFLCSSMRTIEAKQNYFVREMIDDDR